MFDTIPEDIEEGYFPPNFQEYLLKEQLKWSRHDIEDSFVRSSWGWVFWSEQDHEIKPSLFLDNCADFDPNVCAIPKVSDNVRRALQKLIFSPQLTRCLVQFWAPTKTLEGRTKLTTKYQPFALGPTYDKIDRHQACEYRLRMCRDYNLFYADAESGEEQLGILGHVFLHKYPEFTPDVNYYPKKEYPQLDGAIQCFIKQYWVLPVFEYSSHTCVGVLEMVAHYSPSSAWSHESFLHKMHDIFQEFGLICLHGYTHCMQCRDGNIKGHATAFQAQRLAPSPELLKDRGLMLQLGQRVQPSTDAIHGGMNVVSEEKNYILPSLGALQDEEAMMQLDSPHQPPLDSSNNGHNVVTAEENINVVTSLEEGKRKTQRESKGTGVRIQVSLDDILKCAGMKRKGAVETLKVSVSTFKRACREHGIDRWPPRDIENIVGRFRPSPVENQGQTLQLNSNLPSNQIVPGVAHIKPGVQDANVVTFKAKYKNLIIRFKLSLSSTLVEFQREVVKRLHLEAGTYYAEYKDEEGDLISIACDDDLQDCMHTARSQGNTSIEVLLKLEEPLISLVESTRKDPSLLEYIESKLKTKDMNYALCHWKTPRLNMLKSEVADSNCHSKYIMQFPERIRNYIVEVKDVQADGNCGFRAIAALIGLDENKWKIIRKVMLAELQSNSSLYEEVSGEKGRTKELYDKLNYFGDGPAPKDKWLTMPDMGHIVASAFRVVFVFLSNKQCLTFLPFHATPRPSLERPMEDCVCSMGLVDNGHFVQLYMSPGSPMPPIALNWLRVRQPHADGWSAPFWSRIEEFKRIIGSNVATRETFDFFD